MSDASPIDPEAFRLFEQQAWGAVAAGYHDAFSPLTLQAVEPTLDAASVTAGARVLDLASGPGYLAGAAARRGATAVGIDFSPSMVADARRRFPLAVFREADAEAIPFPDGSFDAVTMGFGMLHVARPERVMAEVRRVLRPGARFAFTVWDAPERSALFGSMTRAIQAAGRTDVPLPEGPPFFRFADPLEGRTVLTSAGFDGIEVRSLALSMRVASADALVEKFLGGGVRTRAVLLAQTPEAMAGIRSVLADLLEPYRAGAGYELVAPCVLSSAAAVARPTAAG